MRLRELEFQCHRNVAGKIQHQLQHIMVRLLFPNENRPENAYELAIEHDLAILDGLQLSELRELGKGMFCEAMIALQNAGFSIRNGMLICPDTPQSDPGEVIVNLRRMSRRLGVTSKWLRSEADAGRVPCLRAGKSYLFAPQAVEHSLAKRAASEQKRTES